MTNMTNVKRSTGHTRTHTTAEQTTQQYEHRASDDANDHAFYVHVNTADLIFNKPREPVN